MDEFTVTVDENENNPETASDTEPSAGLFADEESPDPTFIRDEVHPDKKLIAGDRRKTGAAKYEKKMRGVFRDASLLTVTNQNTVSDAAAIILHGPQAARAIGDLAAIDPKIARGVDMLSEGSTNPYVACVLACMPLGLQMIRNHENTEVSSPASFRIPIIKKSIRLPKIHFKFKLSDKMRMFTKDPQEFTFKVLTDPDVVEALKSRGIIIQ